MYENLQGYASRTDFVMYNFSLEQFTKKGKNQQIRIFKNISLPESILGFQKAIFVTLKRQNPI